jgi:beta-lactamase class A
VKPLLAEQLEKMIGESRATDVGIAARALSGGPEILIHADQPFHPASTVKICIMMEAYRQAGAGQISLDNPVLVQNHFRSLADGSPYSLEVGDDSEKDLYDFIGQQFSMRELIRRMITVSSNLASNLLLEALHPERVTAFMQELGTDELRILRGFEDKLAYQRGLNNSATARGFLQILTRLALRQMVSPAASDEMIEILCRQQFNEMIPAGLPAGLRVAHKTGWAADYFHDVGILYPPGREPLVLCILTKGYAEKEGADARAFMARLARAAYEGMLSA